MNKFKRFTLVAVTGTFVSAAAFATDTHTLNVSATVTAVCKFNSAAATSLTIANSGTSVDPSIAVDATGTANVLFRCTSGTTSSISAGNGNNFSGGSRRVAAGTNYIPYSLALSGTAQSGSGFSGAGADKTLSATGTIIQADFQNASAGAYTDVVVLTVTP